MKLLCYALYIGSTTFLVLNKHILVAYNLIQSLNNAKYQIIITGVCPPKYDIQDKSSEYNYLASIIKTNLILTKFVQEVYQIIWTVSKTTASKDVFEQVAIVPGKSYSVADLS